MKKKSQLTVFVTLLLVLLITFSFLFYVAYASTRKSAKKEIDAAMQQLNQIKPINQYIQSCLEKAAVTGIIMIGKQGGVIFPDQKGLNITQPIPNLSLSDGTRVAYRIGNIDIMYCPLNDLYPCPYCSNNPLLVDCFKNYNHTGAVFPRLYYPYGNNPNNFDLCARNETLVVGIGIKRFNCGRGDDDVSGKNFSVQNQLKAFIENNTKACINFSFFEEKMNHSIKEGNISATVLLNEENVIILLEYPLIIELSNNKNSKKMLNFTVQENVRFKTIYDAFFPPDSGNSDWKSIIGKERSNITFNIKNDSPKYNQSNWIVKKTNVSGDYVFTVADQLSVINGSSYVFQFAIKNRRPALDYFSQNSKTMIGMDGNFNDFDVCIKPGENLTIKPIAVDPDEEPVIYTYSDLNVQNNAAVCENPVTGFIETNRCTFFNATNPEEKVLIINATDPAGNSDWQNVKIKVDSNC